MKRMWIAVAMLAVITAFSIWWVWEAHHFTEQVAATVAQAQTSAEQENLDGALQQIRKASRQWSSKRNLYGAMMRHQEADDITVDLAAAEANAQHGQREEFLVLCAQLLANLRHIADMETPKLYNIL